MGFLDNQYHYGDDEEVDKKLRRILRIEPNYLNYYYESHYKYPSAEAIRQRFAEHSARGNFNWLNDSREELDILHERRERKYREHQNSIGEIGFWGAVGGLFGALGGLMFEKDPDYYEEDDYENYYEEEDDY